MVFSLCFPLKENKVATPKIDFQRHTGGITSPGETEPQYKRAPSRRPPSGPGPERRARGRGITAWRLHWGRIFQNEKLRELNIGFPKIIKFLGFKHKLAIFIVCS